VAFIIFAAPALCIRFGFPEVWRRWLSRVVLGAYGVVLTCVGLYFYFRLDAPSEARWVITLANTIVLAGFGTVLTAVFWGPLIALHNKRSRLEPPIDVTRRKLILNSAKAIPVASALLSPAGVQAAMDDPVVRPVKIPIKDLPSGLEGLKILQLTDVHLGLHIDADQFEKIALSAKKYKPDMVVLTGDIADDYSKLGPALDHLNLLAPPLGVYACIGNHEIYRGRRTAEKIYQDRGVHYLCDNGMTVERGGDRFWLAGADDPARLFKNRNSFYKKTIGKALEEKPDEIDVSILLCHRPKGFDSAAEQGVSLTLSGHTHGAQMAIGGRSIFEPFMPKSYLLGHYQKDASHLYTSAGLGHWLPFRLNCPCEGALVELSRA
jgi:hypothetical protein